MANASMKILLLSLGKQQVIVKWILFQKNDALWKEKKICHLSKRFSQITFSKASDNEAFQFFSLFLQQDVNFNF